MKENFHLFAICEKCNNKLYEHEGFMEAPRGKFTFRMHCKKCDNVFQWIFVTQAFRKEATGDVTGNILKDMSNKMKEIISQRGEDGL